MAITTTNANQASAAFTNIANELDNLVKGSSQYNGRGDKPVGSTFSRRNAINGISKKIPWVMSTTEWLSSSPQKALVWYANPSDITWQMGQRSMHTKNMIGTTFHVWADSGRNTFFDELRITLNLQSGNILPIIDGQESLAADGLINFYDFMQLVDAPKLTLGSATSPPRANLVSIQYASSLFPKLTLLGMFDSSGIRFTDSSSSPFEVTSWTADFVVYDTIPKLSNNSGQQSNQALLAPYLEQVLGKNATTNGIALNYRPDTNTGLA